MPHLGRLKAQLPRLRAYALILITGLALTGNSLRYADRFQRAHFYTSPMEFDLFGWSLGALFEKAGQIGLGPAFYLGASAQHDLVVAYIENVAELQKEQAELEKRISEAGGVPPGDPTAARRQIVERLRPVAESVLQLQVEAVVAEMGLTPRAVVFPPVEFRLAPVPKALIVSPRDVIRQEANITLEPGITLQEQVDLERRVEQGLEVSALVVPIGGLGTYPTMVQQTTSLPWLSEVVSHEWTHNYLTLRPLGMNYGRDATLRTMNETVANLMGKAIGRRVMERFYPEFLPQEAPQESPPEAAPPAFDFRAEMRTTRVRVDTLLAAGQIEEAERYMEARRQFFQAHGHFIRRLNQAYFAFYGAYADEPGGAAGDDPVGDAVRQLWARLDSPALFLHTMAGLSSFTDLQALLAGAIGSR